MRPPHGRALDLSPSPTRKLVRLTSNDDLARLTRQFAQIIELLGTGVLDVSDVERAFQDVVDGGVPEVTYQSSQLRFASPEQQVANLLEWNESLLGSALAASQIERVGAEVPAFDGEEALIPLTLCWTLGTLSTSIDAKLDVLREVYGRRKVFITRDFQTDEKHTTNVIGAPAFVPNLVWWQLIDLGSNRRSAPIDVSAAIAAGCEIFDVICQHPVYVSEQDGDVTPYLDLPGLNVKIRGRRGKDTPDISGGPRGEVSIHVNWSGSVYTDHAEPVRRPSD